MRLFTIPTNRICLTAAASYLPELEATRLAPDELLYLVMGDGDAQTEAGNIEAFNAFAPRGARLMQYVPREAQVRWLYGLLESWSQAERERLLRMLAPPAGTCAYGAVLNRIFLIAASLGVEYIHRRDSDTSLPATGDHPLVREIRYLGKPYRDFPELRLPSAIPIFFAGGDYSGDWPEDLKSLHDQDPRLVHRYFALSFPHLSHEEVLAFVQKRYFDQDCDRGTARLATDAVEQGNCGYYKIFERYPVSPATDMLGPDYFIQDVLDALALPSLWHGGKVNHAYTAERRDEQWRIRYQMRFPKFKIFGAVLRDFFRRLSVDRDRLADDPQRLPTGADLAAHLGACLEVWQSSERPAAILAELSGIFADSKETSHQHVARVIKQKAPELVAQTFQDFDDFCLLLRSWGRLISAARSAPLPGVGSRQQRG
jgi:hypothetical protein